MVPIRVCLPGTFGPAGVIVRTFAGENRRTRNEPARPSWAHSSRPSLPSLHWTRTFGSGGRSGGRSAGVRGPCTGTRRRTSRHCVKASDPTPVHRAAWSVRFGKLAAIDIDRAADYYLGEACANVASPSALSNRSPVTTIGTPALHLTRSMLNRTSFLCCPCHYLVDNRIHGTPTRVVDPPRPSLRSRS